ncbi:2-hydroxychromene-2-carboxylate isomerase [Pseudohoeflea coraliihabitans]|uniref:2-hydroxychromene-2-carboxylate isomerase n=1 Tax=Pseudohoeflea coraliihabitans TaxID=2860393 RepID=A0ABS6WNJ3_9HYPH|nr:2-hydroxychromene-2-carboxylate isomerase [Pseudohoeflea sp. DP4N28-3]MBW3097465.1 2-hydroxychromene-2-carboxylate isomerase [Pseudohoeflea sp. DP4N28-3]
MAAIDYYFYSASPFTYLGHRLICDVAERHKAELRFKPVNLARIWEVSGAKPLQERPAVRQRLRLIELQRLASFRNVPLNPKPKHFPVDASLADCVAIALHQDGQDPRYFVGKVLAGVWAEEDNVADEAVLASYLSQCGFDPVPALAEAKTERIKDIRDRNSQEAVEADVVGVPAYVYQGEPFWGQDRIEHLDAALASGRAAFRVPS